MADTFTGKVALVTGSASGIGRATALAFARAGSRLALADVDETAGAGLARAITDTGSAAVFVRTDVSCEDDVERLVSVALTTYGRLDVAFNNAGINEEDTPLTETPRELWDRTLAINLTGIWLCMKYELPAMLRRGDGAIVNTSSVVGLTGRRNAPAYVASKHGIIGLTQSAARDYGPLGIRVNAVCPGTIQTAMFDRRIGTDPATLARLAAEIPVGRLGTAEDVADAVLWLCSDAARFVNGHALVIDGGEMA